MVRRDELGQRFDGGGSMSVSVSKDAKGYRINIRLPGGRTTCFRGKRLGIGNNHAAFQSVAFHIGNLIAAKETGTQIQAETRAWLRRIGKALCEKLERLQLITPRKDDEQVMKYLRDFFALHGRSRKESSKKVWNRALAHAEAFFPKHMTLREVTGDVAKEFEADLRQRRGKRQGSLMAAATVGKTCGVISQAFEHAVAQGIISLNPFGSRAISKSAGANPDREIYVPRDLVTQTIAAATDPEVRLVISLARYGCLRVPSEIRDLRWDDINWQKREMVVASPKTAHHGKTSRRVPLFPELYDELRLVFDLGPTSEFVLPRLREHSNINMRVRRAIREAGLDPWEKALQNLRASGETDWLRQGHPPQDVARWCGHTPKVMFEHYVRITESESASNAALRASGGGGAPGGDCDRGRVVSEVVTSIVAPSGQEKSPDAQAAGDFDFTESEDDLRELVTVGGDSGDHLSMDLIGLEPTTSSMPWMRSSN